MLIAQSISTIDNLEHLDLTDLSAGDYTVRVNRLSGGGTNELFALAWNAIAVPEPGSAGMLAALVAISLVRRR